MSNRLINQTTSLQGNTPFLEIQEINSNHFQFDANSVLALADEITLQGDLTVNGTFNGASIDSQGITISQINATTDIETPKIIFPDNQASGLTIESSDGSDYIVLKSSEGAEQIQLNKNIFIGSSSSSIHGTNGSRGTIQYANIVNSTIAPSCTINANSTANSATATVLQTARNIGGVSFNGGSDINLNGVNQAGNQNTTGSSAEWTTARTNNFIVADSTNVGNALLKGNGTTSSTLALAHLDQSNSSAHKLMITNATSAHTSATLQQQIRFKNEYLPSMAQSDELVGKLTMSKDLFTITQYDTAVSNTSQATTFTRGSDTYPKINSMLRFLQSSAGANISVERDGTYNGDVAQKALPSGIDFRLGSGAFFGGNLSGLQGGIRSNYTSAEVGNTKVFASYVDGTAKEAILLLKPDELSLTNMGIIKFNSAGTISSTGDITLTPQTTADDINLEGYVKITGRDTEPLAKYASATASNTGYNYIMVANRPGEAVGTASLSFFMTGAGHTGADGANMLMLRSNTGGMKLGYQASPQAMYYYGSAHEFNGQVQIQNAGTASGMRLYNTANTAKYWSHSINTDFDYTITNVGGRNYGINAGGNLSLNGTSSCNLASSGAVLLTGDTCAMASAVNKNIALNAGGDGLVFTLGDLRTGSGSGATSVRIGAWGAQGSSPNGYCQIAPEHGFYTGRTSGINVGSGTPYSHYSILMHMPDTVASGAETTLYLNHSGWQAIYLRANNGALGQLYAQRGTMYGSFSASDARIKTEIEDIDDKEALDQINRLELKKYHYIDPLLKNEYKTIGFIAQQAISVVPNIRLRNTHDYVPDEQRYIEDFELIEDDGNWKLFYDFDWRPEDTKKIRFLCYIGDGEAQQEELRQQADGSFIFKEKYDKIFIYGRRVNNFNHIDKTQLNALFCSGIQQLHRLHTALEVKQDAKIVSLESQLKDLISRVALNELALKSLL